LVAAYQRWKNPLFFASESALRALFAARYPTTSTMRHSTLYLLALLAVQTLAQAQNLAPLGQLEYTNDLSDIWGWTDPSGHEYALVGVRDGFSIVDVSSDPTDPTELFFLEGPSSTWRDIKTWGSHAYVVHDNVDPGMPGAPGIGLLIVDLAGLPGSIDTVTIKDFGSGVRFDHAHNVFIDELGFLYVFGANYGAGGAIMLDLTLDPEQPQLAGVYNAQYCHDGFARDNILYTAEIFTGNFSIIDVSSKAFPAILAQQQSPTVFTHNVWLSDDSQVLFSTDEVEGGYLGAYDISDLSDIRELDRWRSNPGSGVVPHNSFVLGNYLITSYYRDGVTVHDISRPGNMVLVGQYDTSPLSGFGFNGAWGVYPYAPSGLIFASDIETGLWILDPDYTQAAWLEGTVSETVSGTPVSGALVQITGEGDRAETDIFGQYGTGVAQAGTYTVEVSAPGFLPTTVSGVELVPGLVTTLDIELESLPVLTVSGQITDAQTGAGIPDANIAFFHPDYRFETTTDADGNYSISNIFAVQYEVVAGKWGYVSGSQRDLDLSTTSNWSAALETGIYDDFSFDFGWQSLGDTWLGGVWERAISLEHDPGYGYPITPLSDNPDDPGPYCFVTGNDGGSDLVHAGDVTLRSPAFDPRGQDRATLRFQAWIFNRNFFNMVSNDGVIVRLSDANGTVTLDTLRDPGGALPQWVEYSYELSEYKELGPGMRVLFLASADGEPFVVTDLLDAAIDAFRVEPFDRASGIADEQTASEGIDLFPNPALAGQPVQVSLPQGLVTAAEELQYRIYSIEGRLWSQGALALASGTGLLDPGALPQGVYTVEWRQGSTPLGSSRLVMLR
jgi:choice-of-anchor B domain-containing protein